MAHGLSPQKIPQTLQNSPQINLKFLKNSKKIGKLDKNSSEAVCGQFLNVWGLINRHTNRLKHNIQES
jgi:hypothetical protein